MINIPEVVSEFKKIDKPLRVIAEESVDGIISGYIFCEFLRKHGKRFVLSWGKKDDNAFNEEYGYVVFISSQKPGVNVFRHFGVNEGDINAIELGIQAKTLS